jgi:hypothetical protein
MSLIPQRWKDRTVVIAASGPSMQDTALPIHKARAQGKPFVLVVVNTTHRLFPYADVLYAGDMLWWKFNYQEVARTFKGEKWTCDHSAAERYGAHRIKGVNKSGLGTQYLHINGNSAAQALNLAYLFGSRRVLLTGYDMKLGPNAEKHWHGDHPKPLVQGQTFGEWIHKFATMAKDAARLGLEVVNCTPGSALSCWPMSTLEIELGKNRGT